jgi:hypothetical protein
VLVLAGAASAQAAKTKVTRPPKISCQVVRESPRPETWYDRILRLTSEFSNVDVPTQTAPTIRC